jgi:hypothetical protein
MAHCCTSASSVAGPAVSPSALACVTAGWVDGIATGIDGGLRNLHHAVPKEDCRTGLLGLEPACT